MRKFNIETRTDNGIYTFMTKANNGKDALKNLIQRSSDYKNILKKNESNDMVIIVKVVK